jgi:hypothetical protein
MKGFRDGAFAMSASGVVIENQLASFSKLVGQEGIDKVHGTSKVGEEKQRQGVRLSKTTESEPRAIYSDELCRSILGRHDSEVLVSLQDVRIDVFVLVKARM